MIKHFKIAIHGGAGFLTEEYIKEQGEDVKATLKKALTEGCQILKSSGTSEEAVTAAVTVLEDAPCLNAGKGAVLNEDAKFELDSAIMNGSNLSVGSIIGVDKCKNPVQLAKYIKNSTKHVVFTNSGAHKLLKASGLPIVAEDYFYTEYRYKQLLDARKTNQVSLDHNQNNKKFGTVGAVALDINGHLAAATSTGGLTNKMVGRVGDTPMIGCGTYANDNTCAISCTGQGEYFIRTVAAHDISALMEYSGKTLEQAIQEVLFNKIGPMGGHGGIIGVDKFGNFSLLFNTNAMIRGYTDETETLKVAIFKDYL